MWSPRIRKSIYRKVHKTTESGIWRRADSGFHPRGDGQPSREKGRSGLMWHLENPEWGSCKNLELQRDIIYRWLTQSREQIVVQKFTCKLLVWNLDCIFHTSQFHLNVSYQSHISNSSSFLPSITAPSYSAGKNPSWKNFLNTLVCHSKDIYFFPLVCASEHH